MYKVVIPEDAGRPARVVRETDCLLEALQDAAARRLFFKQKAVVVEVSQDGERLIEAEYVGHDEYCDIYRFRGCYIYVSPVPAPGTDVPDYQAIIGPAGTVITHQHGTPDSVLYDAMLTLADDRYVEAVQRAQRRGDLYPPQRAFRRPRSVLRAIC